MLWEYVYIGSQVICSSRLGLCQTVPSKESGKSTIRRSTKPKRVINRKAHTKPCPTDTKDILKLDQAHEETKGLGLLLALEPRIMFDGAAFVTGAEIVQDQSTQGIDLQGIDDSIAPETFSDPFTNNIDLLSALSSAIAPSDRKEIVFIDTSVEGYETLLLGIDPNAEAILLDSSQDGIEQIAEILGDRSDIDAIHIISHGSQGELRFGTGVLNLTSMQGEYADELAIINKALTDEADFLIYGCNFGEGDVGKDAAKLLAELTGADIAASNDLTGNSELGGDWDLEVQTGFIESSVTVSAQAQENWQGLLVPLVDTGEFTANDASGNDEETSGPIRGADRAVDIASNGDYVVVWTDETGSDSVHAKVFDKDGNEKVAEFQVNIGGTNNEWANVAMDDSGNFVVTWTQDGDVFMRRFQANGTAVDGTDVLVTTITANTQQNPSVSMNGGGDFVIAWETTAGAGAGIFVRQGTFAGGLIGGDITVDTGTGRANASVDINDAGKFVVVWQQGNEPHAQRFAADGSARGSQIDIDPIISLTLEQHAVVGVQSTGDFVVAYRTEVTGLEGIYMWRYRDDGTSYGLGTKVSSGNSHVAPSISVDSSDNYIIVYEGDGDGSGKGVFGRKYDSGGTAQSAQFQINETTLNGQDRASVAMSDLNNFVAVWTGSDGAQTDVFARQFGTNTNTDPIITSNSGLATAAINAAENQTAVTTVMATDADLPPDTLTFSKNGGADAALFNLDSGTGVLTFTSARDFETFTDANMDGVYEVTVQVNDGNGGVDTQDISVTVTNISPTVLSTTGSASVASGVSYTLNLSANEDVTSWTINWGDGTIDTVAGNPPSVTHTYTNTGLTFNILASATDVNGTYLQNELLVPRYTADSIFRFEETTGAFLQQFAPQSGGLNDPIQTIIGPDGNLYVTGEFSDNVVRYNPITGAKIDEFITTRSGGLNSPGGLTFGPDGNLYVGSYQTHEVLRYDGTTGAFIDVFATGVTRAYGVTFGPDGNLYVSSFTGNTVVKFDGTTGASLGTFVTANAGGLNIPERMIFGPDGNLYIASAGSDEVLRYNGTTGMFIDAFVSAGLGGLNEPGGIDFGPDGNFYVSGQRSDNVLRYDGTTGAFLGEYVSAATGLNSPAMFTFLPGHQVLVTNAPPTLDLDANDNSGATGNDYQFTFNEDDGATAIADDDTDLVDVDSTTFASVELAVSGLLDGNAETLVLDGSAFALATAVPSQDTAGLNYRVAIATGAGTATIAITKQDGGTFSEAETETLIEAIQYQHTDTSAPTDGDRFIDVIVNDGIADSVAARTTINIDPANDLPVITNLSGDTLPYPTASGALVLDQNAAAAVSDVDSTNFDTGTLTVAFTAGNDNAEDELGIQNVGTNPGEIGVSGGNVTYGGLLIGTFTGGGSGGGALVITLNTNADATAVSALIQNITYENTDLATPTLGARTVSFTITDGDGGTSAISNATVNVSAQLAPVITNLSGDTLAYTEGDGAAVIEQGSNAVVSDMDSADFDTGTLTVAFTAGNDNAEDELGIQNVGTNPGEIGVSGGNVTYGGLLIGTFTGGGSGGGALVITLNTNADATAVSALIQNITYENTDTDNPTTSARTVRYALTDGDGGTSLNYDTTVTVTAVNDVPVATGNTVVAQEDVPLVIGPVDFSFTDVEGDSLVSVTITGLTLNGGTLTHSAGAVPVTNGMTVTLAELADLTFTSALHDSTDSSFAYTVNDGGLGVTSATMNITVNAVNDAPVITSDGGGATASESAQENQTTITTVRATDVDLPADTLTFSINGGADTALFSIDTGTGVLTFTSARDFETFTDADSNGVYEVTVQVDDGNGGVDTQALSVTVTDVVEANVLTVDTTVDYGSADARYGDTSSIGALLGNKGSDNFISLREAIDAANNTANTGTADEIRFNIADNDAGHLYYRNDLTGGLLSSVATTTVSDAMISDFDPDYPYMQHSWFRIDLNNALPQLDITDAVIINGYTQAGATQNTLSVGDNATLRIELTSSGADGNRGLTIQTGGAGSSISGLAINGFDAAGILTEPGADNVTVQGNFIGTDVTGTIDLGNGGAGIHLRSSDNQIGSFNAADRNVISGNQSRGVTTFTSGPIETGNVIQNNYIGTDATGIGALGNSGTAGVQIYNQDGLQLLNNVIGNNANQGVRLLNSNSIINTVIQGNLIGVGADGTTALGHSSHGILIDEAVVNTTIGGILPGQGNTIANNAGDGITISDGTGTAIRGNRIFNNGELGIDLLGIDGVNNNDTGDSDGGANNLQNFPVLSTAKVNGTDLTINGTLNSGAGATFNIDFYASATADGSEHGEAERYLGSASVTTDSSGNATISQLLSGVGVLLGEFVTATVTDSNGNTSELSLNVTAIPAITPPIAIPDSFTINEGSPNTLDLALNDTDVDDGLDLASITIITGPTNGTITSINSNGTVEYTHNGSETLSDSFTYTINDLAGTTSNTVTVSLTVTPQNDAPFITSDGGGASASVPILTGDTAATDVNAFDAEGAPVTYSITGGADAALFTIDPATGVLTFQTAPNVETPTDVGGDNIYDVIVQASDGTLTDTQAIAVTVADLPFVVLPPTADPPSESGSESGEEDTGESEDEITGNVLQAGSNTHRYGSSVNQSSTGDDPNNSNQLNHLAKDNEALLQHLREGKGIIQGTAGDLMGVFQQSFERTTLKSEIASLLGTTSGFLKDLDEARDALNDVVATEKTYVASSIAASTGLSVGYVFWLLRSGVLLTALLSSVPAWQFVNPLLVLDTPTKKKRRKDQEDLEDDSVESMFKNHSEPTHTSQSMTEKEPTSH